MHSKDQPKSAKYAIFDMDGLLLDTEVIYTKVTQEVVKKYGKTYDWRLKSNMIGRPAIDSARYLVNALDLPITPEEYLKTRNKLLHVFSANCQAMPGAKFLIQHLHASGIPMALATSSYKPLFETKTQNHKSWFKLFDVIVTGDDPEIERGKPAPDIFLIAASRLGANPAQTLIFEDAPSGLQAGLAANMRVIAVPDPNMDRTCYIGATMLLENLEQFDCHAFFGGVST